MDKESPLLGFQAYALPKLGKGVHNHAALDVIPYVLFLLGRNIQVVTALVLFTDSGLLACGQVQRCMEPWSKTPTDQYIIL